jgi:hypothetical protein
MRGGAAMLPMPMMQRPDVAGWTHYIDLATSRASDTRLGRESPGADSADEPRVVTLCLVRIRRRE